MTRLKPSRTAAKIRLFQTSSLGLLMLALPAAWTQAASAQETTNASAVDRVTVYGLRLSEQKSIEEQKDASTVANIATADDLGKLPDANVADAVARLPGVNVVVNQDTGEGEFVTIRGFAGTYNAYSINGVRVAEADGDSRRVSLTVLPPNGLEAIEVSKTLTPDMDGDAIGGAINFRTPTAFDFKDPVLRGFLNYGYNDRADQIGIDSKDYGAELQYGSKFGDKWGLFVAANYQKTHGANEETENDGEWEPYHFRLNSTEDIDGRSLYLPGIDLDYRQVEQTRFGGNFSLDYRDDNQQLYLKGQYARFERVSDNNYTDFRSRPTARLRQVNIDDTSLVQPDQAVIGSDPTLGRIYNYTASQIVDADGDGRITDHDALVAAPGSGVQSSYWSLYGRSGVWNPQAMQFARSYQITDQNQTLATVNAGGKSKLNALTLDYDVSYSYGLNESPDDYSVGYNCDRCGVLGQYGVLWSSYDPRFPLPQLAPQVADVERRDDYLAFDGAEWNRSRQTDKRLAAKLDATYDLNSFIDFAKAGFKYLQSKRDYDRTPIWEGDLLGAAATTLDKSGLVASTKANHLDGRYYYGSVLGRQQLISAVHAAEAADPSDFDENDLNGDDKRGEEDIYAGYALANMKFATGSKPDALEVIAGVRVEHTEVSNDAWDDEAAEGFVNTKSDYTDVLPSVTVNWRPDDQYVVRGAAWTSISRPEYSNMFSGERVTRNAQGEIVARLIGSPNLKPAYSTNFDLSLEYYPDRHTLMSVGGFYKSIDKFIFTNGTSVSTSTSVGFEDITQVKNGGTAHIHGFEGNFIREFVELPAPFDGLGVSANVTYQDSSAETGLDYRAGRKIPFVGAPDLLYNASLSYQKWGLQMLLSYNYQGKYIEDLRDNAIDKWVQPNKSLDFHSRYSFNEHFSVDFDVQNILDGWRYYTTKGDSPSYQKDYMEPGRTFILKAAFSY